MVRLFLNIRLWLALGMSVANASLVKASTLGITYQGVIYDQAGQPLSAASVNFVIGIVGGSNCLLYQESFAVEIASGVFSLPIGSVSTRVYQIRVQQPLSECLF